MKRLNKNSRIGIIIFAVILTLNNLIGLPDFVHGLGLGTAIAFMLIGAYSVNHDISKFKSFKRNFFTKYLNR